MNPTLIEYFAAHETLNDLNQVPPEHVDTVTAMLKHLAGPIPKDDLEASAAWDAKWRAKLRFIRAKAMAEEAERIRGESQTIHPEQQRQAEQITQLFSEQSRDMKAAPPKASNLSFSEALESMKQGKKARRLNRKSIEWFQLAQGDILMASEVSTGGPYTAVLYGQDILAEDWEILPEEPK